MAGVRQFDEEQVLADALTLFWQKGFVGTSMQELAAATGVQRGSLYNAYGGKEALFIAAYRCYLAKYMQGIKKALAQPQLKDALAALFDFSINLIRTDRRGCLTTKTATSESATPAIHEALRAQMDNLKACITERLMQSPQELALPVADAALLLLTHTRGIVVMERLYDDPEQLRDSAKALVQLLVK